MPKANRYKSPYQEPQEDAIPAERRRTGSSRPRFRLPFRVPNQGRMFRVLEGNLVFVIFLAVLGVGYIWNAHYSVRQAHLEAGLKEELKEMKSAYTALNAELSVARQQTSILATADSLGLHIPAEPPYRLQGRQR